ncbi:MAG: M50 family metallopeptidase [Chthonomonadales bacterium]
MSFPGGRTVTVATARMQLILATVVSLILWQAEGARDLLYPIRLFVTVVHEGFHALVTVLTGGRVVSITINPDTSGVTLSQGGMPFWIFMAGYLGAALYGSCAIHLCRHRGGGRGGLIFLAATMLVIAGLWINPFGPDWFGFVYAVVAAGLLAAGAKWMKESTAAAIVSFLSVQVCLNAIFDLRDLLLITTNTNRPNDAVFMANEYWGAPWFWAGLWSITSLLMLWLSLKLFWRKSDD